MKRFPETSSKGLTLGGQDQKKGATSVKTDLTSLEIGLTGPEPSVRGGTSSKKRMGLQTGLTGLETGLTCPSGSSRKNSRNIKKKRPSFKEVLAKYEEKGATQKQEKRLDQAKDTN